MSRSLAALACVMIAISNRQALAQAVDAVPSSEPSAEAAQTLDGLLLDGLNAATSSQTEKSTANRPGRGMPRSVDGPRATDGAPIEQPTEGEDLGSPSPAFSLLRIGHRMQLAGQSMASDDTSKRTQDIQVEIIDDLSRLIAQTEQQCKSNSASRQSVAAGGRQNISHADPAAGPQTLSSSSTPARDSSRRQGEGKTAGVGTDVMDSFIKKTWGHLPPQLRQSVFNVGREKFLPKYEMLIEQYYRRLAEDAKRQP